MDLSNSQILKELNSLDWSSGCFPYKLNKILHREEFEQCAVHLKGGELMWLVQYLDKAVDSLDSRSIIFRKCLSELRRICGTMTVLPTSHQLLISCGPAEYLESGGQGDTSCIPPLRLKTVDVPGSGYLPRMKKALCREAVTWKRLEHRNIVPILNVNIDRLEIASVWMPNGNILEYIKKHPEADRVALLSDVAEGLCYLHSFNVVHQRLKGKNVIVDDTGQGRITDFGLAMINPLRLYGYEGVELSWRWTAPEVLNGGPYSKASDIFSFAMLMVEVFTGEWPFPKLLHYEVAWNICIDERPPRPTYPAVTNQMWKLMQRCWGHDPASRPSAEEVLRVLPLSASPSDNSTYPSY